MGMDVYGLCPRGEAGQYFRANIYSWRPILCLCIDAEENVDELDVDFRPWNYNDGGGLKTQRECDLLADAIERLLRGAFEDGFADDPLFADFDLFVDAQGEMSFFRRTDAEGRTRVEGQRNVPGEYVWEWVHFLRDCGGFAIY